MLPLRLCIVIVVAAVSGCTAGQREERVPPTRLVSTGALVVYAYSDDLWLYEATADRTRRLTWNGVEPAERHPRFRSAGTVTYLADGAVYSLDVATGKRRLVVRQRTVIAFAWSPDGETLAYIVQPGGVGRHVLYFFRPSEGRARLVRRFPGPTQSGQGDGSGRLPDEEVELAWSPSGARLLLVDTDLAPQAPTLYVFLADGREGTFLRSATHAGWVGDFRLYFRTLRGAGWSLLDLRQRNRSRLRIARGRMHPALSPDRRFLALDSGRPWEPGTTRRGCACTISVYDLATGRERSLGTGLVAPLWLAPRSLAATEVRACVGAECGVSVPMWVLRRRTARLGVETGERRPLALRSTLDADVLLASG